MSSVLTLARKELRQVVPGYKTDQLQVIESGLEPGERVVFEGVQRLRDGAPIVPKAVRLDEKGAPLEEQPAEES